MDKRTAKRIAYDVAAGVLNDHIASGCVYESIGHRLGEVEEADALKIANALEDISWGLNQRGNSHD